MSKWAEMGSKIRVDLCLTSHPIGYKRLEKAEELDLIPSVNRVQHFCVFCQMFAQARKLGITVGVKNTDNMNSHCARIHGLKDVPAGMNKPNHGLRWVCSWEDEIKRFKAFPRIPPGGAIVLAPLTQITFDPDVIMIYGNPAQIILIIQSLQREKFERFEFACIGESSCADSLADCYLTGKPKVGLPGYGERMFGQVGVDEMVIALPPDYLEQALQGLNKLKISYPIPFFGLDIDHKDVFARAYPDDPEFK
jgi:uncharacterized protein (DUF169 family)